MKNNFIGMCGSGLANAGGLWIRGVMGHVCSLSVDHFFGLKYLVISMTIICVVCLFG